MADNDRDDRHTDDVNGDRHTEDVDEDRHTDEGNSDQNDDDDGMDPDEMSLEELRAEIASIDREIVELIAQRTYVADTIADVKRDRGLPTTDEQQEAEVMARAGENAERFDVDANLVKAIFRLLIELNKVEQRENR